MGSVDMPTGMPKNMPALGAQAIPGMANPAAELTNEVAQGNITSVIK